MDNEAGLLLDLVAAMGIALAGGWLAARLGLSAMAGYVAAGILISPFTPGFVGDLDRLRLLADVGVVLLMFGIGVEFSLRDLARQGAGITVAAAVQVALVMLAGTAVGLALGWGRDQALFAGAAVAISSSTVIVKLLGERGEASTPFGRAAIAWSIVQDICAVVIVAVLISLTDEGNIAGSVGVAALKAAAFVAGVLVIGIRVVPLVLAQVAERGSRELFVLAIAALALGTALASERVGLSLALGAFLAGIVVSEADLSHRVLGDLLPARDVFAVLFFVAAGMLIDPEVIVDNVLPFALLLIIIVPLKGAATALLARAGGLPARSATLTGASLAQAGEFTFVLIGLGLDEGAVDSDVFSLVVAAAALSIVLTPAVMAATTLAVQRLGGAPPPVAVPVPAGSGRGHKAVVCGYGETGRTIVKALSSRFDVLVVDADARALADAAGERVRTLSVDAASPTAIDAMGLEDCRVLVVTIGDPFAARLLVERAHAMYPDLDIIARAHSEEEAARLRRSGARETVVAGREVALEMVRHSLHRFGVDSRQALAIVQRMRLGERG